jgi:hypothetical protein
LLSWFEAAVVVLGTVVLSVIGLLLVRRWVAVEVLERHNEVAGFVYAVIGVIYAVLLAFTAVIVWEQFNKAEAAVENEANAVADLYHGAQSFKTEVQQEIEAALRDYVSVVVQKEWSAMARGLSSAEASTAYDRLWHTYRRFEPQSEQEKLWYAQALKGLDDLGDQRTFRLLSSRSKVPAIVWVVLIGGGIVTIGYSWLFGTSNASAQGLMTAALALTIALVMVSIMALEHPFSGFTYVEPYPLTQAEEAFRDGLPQDLGR